MDENIGEVGINRSNSTICYLLFSETSYRRFVENSLIEFGAASQQGNEAHQYEYNRNFIFHAA